MKNIVLIACLTLAGCATKYQPFSIMGGGYKDEKRDDGSFWLKYTGATSGELMKTVVKLWNQRAHELCGAEPKELKYEEKWGPSARIHGFSGPASPPSPVVEGFVYCS